MSNRQVCERKKAYDTEFEATIAAAKRSSDWGEEIEVYACKNHWHITHAQRELRNQHIRPRKDYCEVCKQSMRPSRYAAHIKKEGHIRNVQRLKDERTEGNTGLPR